jgi:hypothetical protein
VQDVHVVGALLVALHEQLPGRADVAHLGLQPSQRQPTAEKGAREEGRERDRNVRRGMSTKRQEWDGVIE